MARIRVPAADVHEVLHGFTLADLERLVGAATRLTNYMASDVEDRYSAARFGILEALYTADTTPQGYDLINAGRRAIQREVESNQRYLGMGRDKNDRHRLGLATAPHFLSYWMWLNKPTPSPERRIVETTALAQIMPLLTEGQRTALLALAATDDYAEAAAALHITETAFRARVSTARKRFFAYWHEGETPSRLWAAGKVDPRGVRYTMRGRRYAAKYVYPAVSTPAPDVAGRVAA